MKGSNGTSCKIAKDEDGVITIQCGEGENITETTLYKALCGSKAYDPDKKFCDTRDNKVYRFVTIGEGESAQIWMAENLNYSDSLTYKGMEGRSWCRNDEAENCTIYGRLYTWAAAMDSVGTWSTNAKGCGYGLKCSPILPVRGMCPQGWHLPSKAEWETLIVTVDGSIQEYKDDNTASIKLKSTSGWYKDGNGTDSFLFSGVPSGYKETDGSYNHDNFSAYFWSSTEANGNSAYRTRLFYETDSMLRYSNFKNFGFSIRCLKDD